MIRKKTGCDGSDKSSSRAARMTTGNLGACLLSRDPSDVAMSSFLIESYREFELNFPKRRPILP